MEKNFIAIYDLSPQRKILYLSDSVYEVLGYWPDELIGKSGLAFIPEEEVSGANTFILYQEINDSITTLFYSHCHTKDNKVIPIEAAASCCYNMITAVIGVADTQHLSCQGVFSVIVSFEIR
ncbi:hypothetical protein K7432_017995 [Basidiobolus ranarum]|uniref:PAS domain-containing protein n=1 Tax=Basidiobolus ranarum TaxID=34480 RepID=A0ABR2WCQ0_9FUNG